VGTDIRALGAARNTLREDYGESHETQAIGSIRTERPTNPRRLPTKDRGGIVKPITDHELDRTIDDLRAVPGEIQTAAYRVADLEADLAAFKAQELREAQDEYDSIVNASTMKAYASGAIDGRNASMRDDQLTYWLGNDTRVAEAKAQLHEAEATVAALEGEVARAQAEYKAATYRHHALRAVADLQRAMLDMASSGVEDEVAAAEHLF